MKDTCYLVFTRRGIERMNKQQIPSLKSGERLVRIELVVPEEVFQPKDIPTITLAVPSASSGVVPAVVVDPNDPELHGTQEHYRKQAKINQAAGKLLERALRGGDSELQAQALSILNELQADGIEVRVDVPDLELPGGEA